MPNFLFIYRGGDNDPANYSPEEMQEHMQEWMNWINEGCTKGWMTDAGDALLPGGKVVNPKKVVTDGPFPESKEVVGGYSVVKADTLEQASELAKGCPALQTGGMVEVRQMAEMAPPRE